MISVFYEVISDPKVREQLKSLIDQLNQMVWIKGRWQFTEVTLDGAVTSYPIAHSLGFKPKDIILLHNSTGTDVTWVYSSFTRERIYVTTTGPATLRFYVGLHGES